jgi:branched-chain amino acid transport system ATP-binding protein
MPDDFDKSPVVPLLTTKKMDAFYGDVQVLRQVSVTVPQGGVTAVIGPNGAGKSTLLKALVGLVDAEGGEGSGVVTYDGKILDYSAPEEVVRLGLTLVQEGGRVFPELSCLDNLKLGAYVIKAPERRTELLTEVLNLLPRLKERTGQKARTLSGGERQMLAIGRALMSDPRLLLLDEPSLGLDPLAVSRIFKILQEITARGKTILLVEQKVAFALKMSQYGYVLENGSVVLEGTGRDLLNNPYVRKAYLAV